MLDFLFGGLTARPAQGAPLFDAATRLARKPGWYRQGSVPDTLDGRFAMLATVIALILVRLEALGETGNALSVALTERFVEVMESEHRELGLGDPKLGRTVRKLVGGLSRRVDLWREVEEDDDQWVRAVEQSLPLTPPAPAVVASSLRELRRQLDDATPDQLGRGEIG